MGGRGSDGDGVDLISRALSLRRLRCWFRGWYCGMGLLGSGANGKATVCDSGLGCIALPARMEGEL